MNSSKTNDWPRAVLFDFDGTLADSYGAIAASVNHIRTHHGLPPLDEPEVCRHVGRGLVYLLEHTVPDVAIEAGVALYREHHPSIMRSGTQLLPGAAEVLEAVKRRGRLVAVCSNKPRVYTRALVDHLGLAPVVDEVLGPEDVNRPKPAPDMVEAALTRLQTDPADALYVGDMVIDIQTARAAGVCVWVVPTGSEERAPLVAAQPDRMLEDLNELARWFA